MSIVDENPIVPTGGADEARRLGESGPPPPPPRPAESAPPSRVGRWAIVITAAAILLLAGWLAIDSMGDDPNDPGWVDVALFVSPILAAAAAFVMGLVLIIVAAAKLVRVTVGRTGLALVVGLVGAPILYFVIAIVIAFVIGIDTVPTSFEWAVVTCIVPALCGTGVTLAAASDIGRLRPAGNRPI